MRERLTFAFVALTLLLLSGAGFVRSYAISDRMRDLEGQYLTWQATSLSESLSDRIAAGEAVDQDALTSLSPPGVVLTYLPDGGSPLTVSGAGATTVGDDDVDATVVMPDAVLTLSRAPESRISALGGDDLGSLAGLFALLGVLAGVAGYVVARALANPFRQLAGAAAALGRGRFDLELPRTRVPEARAIAQALESSAAQLKDRLEREREFGLHASHVLRTPLTSLRLHLEELTGDPALSGEAREAALGCHKAVEQLSEVAGELVDISRRGVLVAGAAQPLRDVATSVAQRWADVLDGAGRELTAAVEGDLDLAVTPGPIEQVLDLVLSGLVVPDTGSARLVFEGAASRLRIDVTCGTGSRSRPPSTPVGADIKATLVALGGSIEVPRDAAVLRVHLPRR